MRSILSTYGWIIVTIIVLMCLVTLATPYGQNFMDNMYYFTDALTAQKNHYIDYDDCNIYINNNTDNIVNISNNLTQAKPGSVITLTFNNENELVCNSVKLEYNNQTETIKGTEFFMPNYDVTVTPIWTPAEYSKIYFNNLSAAQKAAAMVNDEDFGNTDRTVTIDGNACYVVHDNSSELGYNNQCATNLYNNNNVVKIITGTNCSSISDFAFKDAVNLKYLSLSESVREIKNSAFSNCTSLSTIILSNKLESIDTGAFYNCVSLTGVFAFDATISYIGDYAFSQTGYSSVNMPQGLKHLGSYAFYNCPNITESIIESNASFAYGEHVSNFD